MTEFSPREEELLSRLEWFIKLRWLFVATLAVLLFGAIKVFLLRVWITPIAIIATVVLLYNLGFYIFHYLARHYFTRKLSRRGLRIEANLQIGLDLLAMVTLIHYSGGLENPFIFFFVFHMIMGSILLSGRDIWFQMVGSGLILFTLLMLTYFGVIEHHRIDGFASPDLWFNQPYLLAGSASFAATMLMAVYMTSSISHSVLSREEELVSAKTLLENKSLELEHANAELIRRQSLLIQSEKLASLGKLSAGIAHELNNPLTGILNFSYFIKEACEDDEGVQRDIKVVIRETERCKKIIKGLLDFARQNQPEKKSADVIKTLNRTVSLVENHKDFKNIEIIRDYDEYLPSFMFDADQMQQVFMNLIVNAQEAMAEGGTIYIRVKYKAAENQMEISFRDSGTGIDPEHLQKIFDPFYTTKEMGTGLGLSISMGIIQNHGGTLEVISKSGEGSAFVVNLPLADIREEVWL
jgi:signal transduction histidine kinase